ncbi:hypothetical protein HNQ59_001592 [Chitinivorax tropicus]|uniref:Uncharacterized protein n=1 Tax=Chitinivorax tropicus TaxID=714531 RepID=A0A840MGD5_9PROT|nr:hypothetical protein [Chitinivorax tropicus]MBB5018304.1 hypothetical protein [Chitinivorax tropicus]
MLELNLEQWQALQRLDAGQFVAAVAAQFQAQRPDSDRTTVQTRMQAAHDYATKAGFTSTPHIIRLLYLATDAPHIHDDPVVDSYLRKPGATPEQRLDDLDAVINAHLKRKA